MGDVIAVTNLVGAFVQKNGIIRIADGRYIGRLEDIEYGDIASFEDINPVIKANERNVNINRNILEHLLNCMCNQKYIHEQNAETKAEWQEIIDKSYHEVRSILSPPKNKGEPVGCGCGCGATPCLEEMN